MRTVLPFFLLGLTACSGAEPVPYVDLDRYDGLWYEIATIPSFFQKDCTGTTAEYTLQSDGTVGVTNTCYLGDLDGTVNEIDGYAYAKDESNADLKLFLDGAPSATYLIIGLSDNPGPEDYDWAVVGSNLPGFLWILNREPQMEAAELDAALAIVDAQGYDRDDLVYTLQPSL